MGLWVSAVSTDSTGFSFNELLISAGLSNAPTPTPTPLLTEKGDMRLKELGGAVEEQQLSSAAESDVT